MPLNLELKQLTEGEAEALVGPFTEAEVHCAVLGLGADKSPGPDGFTMLFFHRAWSFIKNDVMGVVKQFEEHNYVNWRLNCAFITLIPKEEGAQSLEQFRPISLLNSSVKILSKCLANRLKNVMNSLISESQGASIEGRAIGDNIMVTSELLDSRKRSGKGGIVIKVDFWKAFDTVNWTCIIETMKAMGFNSKWCAWIHAWLDSARLSVLVNGSPVNLFKPARGVRQGDPLSPLVFTLIAEILTRIILKLQTEGAIQGFSPHSSSNRQIPIVQYADDTLIFCDAEEEQVATIKAALMWFEEISGLKMNLLKTNLFGINTNEGEVQRLAEIMGCKPATWPLVYLGIPLGASFKNRAVWNNLIGKFEGRLGVWKRKLLSKAGRLQLIKSTLNAIPVHLMSFLLCPKSVIAHLEKRIREFLWGSSEKKRKLSLVGWNSITLPVDQGGLGLRRLDETNVALLMKWLWRFGEDRDSWWRKVVFEKYGESASGWYTVKTNKSYGMSIWGHCLWCLQNFKEMVSVRVNNGENASFWCDNWTGTGSLKDNFSGIAAWADRPDGSVAEHLTRDIHGELAWDLRLRRRRWPPDMQTELDALLDTLPLPLRLAGDDFRI